MDNIHDYAIVDESTDDKLQYTIYCKGLARARIEEYNGRLWVQQMMIGPTSVDEFKTFAHGLIEFLLVLEGAVNEHQNRKTGEKKKEGCIKKRQRRI